MHVCYTVQIFFIFPLYSTTIQRKGKPTGTKQNKIDECHNTFFWVKQNGPKGFHLFKNQQQGKIRKLNNIQESN
jgi:hypothetical protein